MIYVHYKYIAQKAIALKHCAHIAHCFVLVVQYPMTPTEQNEKWILLLYWRSLLWPLLWMYNIYFWAFKHFYLVFNLNFFFSSHFFPRLFDCSLSTFHCCWRTNWRPRNHTFRFILINKYLSMRRSALFSPILSSILFHISVSAFYMTSSTNILCVMLFFSFIVLPMSRFTP